MRRTVTVLLACVVALAGAASAQASVTGSPDFSFSPWTKAQSGAGNAVTVNFIWLPPVFSPTTPPSHQELVVTTEGVSTDTFSTGIAGGPFPILTTNGRNLTVSIQACQVADCNDNNSTLSGPKTTRVDGTPPAGTVQINGGAAATNNRQLTLNVTATDPLIENLPGTSSGVTHAAIDVDGDGTFPCAIFGGDTSGCAVAFAPSLTTTVAAGDGLKTVGVTFGDGARQNTAPCPTGPFIFCLSLFDGAIPGNVSAAVTDTILLDTAKPLAIATQNRFTVTRGQAVQFDALASAETGAPTAQSGLDLAASTWSFSDGTPNATGASVSHTYSTTGTFVGSLRVRDRAGNVSDPRPFSVTVDPAPGDAAVAGSVAGVSGSAAFRLTRLAVTGRYVRSSLKGSLRLAGSSTAAGTLRVQLRRPVGSRVLATLRARLPLGDFTRTLTLPQSLVPGTYRVALVGPGGTLRSRLTLRAPREGVVGARRVVVSGNGARARFTFAARPVRALRSALSVRWTLSGQVLGTVPVGSGRVVNAALPNGVALGPGRLVATLRANTTVIASARVRVR